MNPTTKGLVFAAAGSVAPDAFGAADPVSASFLSQALHARRPRSVTRMRMKALGKGNTKGVMPSKYAVLVSTALRLHERSLLGERYFLPPSVFATLANRSWILNGFV